MRRRLLPLVLLIAAGSVSGLIADPARAALLGDARVSFSALRTVTVNGHAYTGRLFHAPGHERDEQDLGIGRGVFLIDAADKHVSLVLPQLHTYVDVPFPPEMTVLEEPDLVRHPIGREAVSGIATSKFKVDRTLQNGAHVSGNYWVSDKGVLMKFDVTTSRSAGGKTLAVTMTLSDLKEGVQDGKLFEVPKGLTSLPLAALGPLLGPSH